MATNLDQIYRQELWQSIDNKDLYLKAAKLVNLLYLRVKVDIDFDYLVKSSWDFCLIEEDNRQLECSVLPSKDGYFVSVVDDNEGLICIIELCRLNKIAIFNIDKARFIYEKEFAYGLHLLNMELLKSINSIEQQE